MMLDFDTSKILFFVILGVCVFLFFKYSKKFKIPKCQSLNFINGGVKTFKSGFSFYLARRTYRQNVFAWRVSCFLSRLFHRKAELPEKPLFYSNIPVGFDYVQVEPSMLLGETRLAYKSVMFIDEMSLFADKDLYKILSDKNRDKLTRWFKLFGHMTHGGAFFSNSQALGDVCIEFRRDVSQYFYTYHLIKGLPFFYVLEVREERFSEDNGSMSNYQEDIQDCMKQVLIPKRFVKYYDQYCYSILTDNLPVANKVVHGADLDDLKARKIVSFKEILENEKA